MNKLSKQQYKNKNHNASKFIAINQLNLLIGKVFPKLLKGFNGKHKKLWEETINKLLPKTKLGFNNENDYLKSNEITKEDVIINSINYIYPNLEKEEVNYLLKCFKIFTKNNKIKVLTIDNKLTPIYYEIINSLAYLKKIKNIIDKYPKNNGNHHGTKYRSSSINTLIKTQLNILENRLEGRFFTVEDENEIKKLEIQIKFIKYSLTDEYKDFPEWMNFAKIYLGFDNNQLEMTVVEIQAFNQLLEFFNGIRTSKEELLISTMIYLRTQSNIKNDDTESHKELSESIINIVRFFFNETIIEVEKSKKKKTIVYKEENVKKDYCIKTHLSELPIYTYIYKNTNNPMQKFMEASFNSIVGIQNIFEKDKPKEDEISNFQMAKNIMKLRKEFDLTKEEFKTFLLVIDYYYN